MCKENWDFIYTSDLLRAKQTAEIIGEKLPNIPLYLEPRLREAGGGQIEGTTEEERIVKWGKNWRELDLGIESADNVIARGLSVIEEVVSKHGNKNILIVSHGAFIRHLLKELVPHLHMAESPKNTSLTKLIKLENAWDSELYNCTVHLD
ncbi:histidine phosphatase family protein [Bacillus sp. JJ864]|uniref:histidine phosphatase family protein n=1 Tax=Bacillus sp. JJ864 TaxID=3122975 RepID=UPI002FFF87E2